MNTSSLIQKVWNFCHTLRDGHPRVAQQRAATGKTAKPRGRKAKEQK